MKKIFFLLLVVVLVFAGKFYVENKYEDALNEVILLSPASFKYDDIKLGFDGSLSLNGVRIDIPDGVGVVEIKTIKALSSDRFLFLKKNKPTDISFNWLQLSIDELAIDLNPSIYDELGFCNTVNAVYSLAEQGGINASLFIDLNFEDQQNSKLTINYKDKFSFSDSEIDFSYKELVSSFLVSGVLPIHDMVFEGLIESEYAALANKNCAEEFEVSVDDYIKNIAASPKFFHDSFGYNLGQEANLALAEYMLGGKLLVVKSTPSDLLKKTRSYGVYSAASIARWLNLKVTLNNKKVAINYDSENDSKNLLYANQTTESVKAVIEAKPSFKATSISSLSKYKNKRVKILRSGNKGAIEGSLLRYQKGIAFVEARKFGGLVVFEVSKEEIKKLYIFR